MVRERDWLDESEYPDEDEWDDGESETVPCAACGAEVYEEAVCCPSCGEYLTTDTSVWTDRSWWWIGLGLLGIAAVVLALLFY